MTATLPNKIDRLEQRLQQLKAKQKRVEARKRTLESRRSRRDDTRRKILVGTIVLAKIDQGVIQNADLMSWLDGSLSRPEDRALFGL